MLRAALLTLQYAQDHGSIGLTKTKAFKRVFVHWAVEHFAWPGKSAEVDLHRFCSGHVLMLGGPLFEGHW